MTTYLTRYQQGEHEQVWSDLLRYGKTVRRRAIYSDAYAVARETMRRVQLNIEQLVFRLRALDYEFENPEAAYQPPRKDAYRLISDLERGTGTLPVSVRAFYEVVGSVDLRGHHPTLVPGTGYEPLVMYPVETILEAVPDEPLSFSFGGDQPATHRLMLAPHLAGTSDSRSLMINVPDLAIDAVFADEAQQVTFVNYLRASLRWAGFPASARLQETDRPIKEINYLTEGFLPF